MNALESPSVIINSMDVNKMKNPFESPAIQVNGAKDNAGIDIKNCPSVMMLSKSASATATDALESPGVEYLGIDKEKSKNAQSSPSLQFTSESKTKNGRIISHFA